HLGKQGQPMIADDGIDLVGRCAGQPLASQLCPHMLLCPRNKRLLHAVSYRRRLWDEDKTLLLIKKVMRLRFLHLPACEAQILMRAPIAYYYRHAAGLSF